MTKIAPSLIDIQLFLASELYLRHSRAADFECDDEQLDAASCSVWPPKFCHFSIEHTLTTLLSSLHPGSVLMATCTLQFQCAVSCALHVIKRSPSPCTRMTQLKEVY